MPHNNVLSDSAEVKQVTVLCSSYSKTTRKNTRNLVSHDYTSNQYHIGDDDVK